MNIATDQIKDVLTRARTEVSKVIIGQDDVVDKALIAIFTGHHALIEGVPGVAKTLLVRTLARVLGCEFNRIQFTPDLMPADITGTSVFNMQKTGPLMSVNSFFCILKTLVPVMSAGIRSGVNWMRLNSHPSTRASVRTSSVFATPGTPSMSAWWPVKMAMSALSTTSSWPMMTLLTSVRARVRTSLIWSVAMFIFSGKWRG